uniref:SprT-like domain-containing protein n=1 Tax=Schistocephalus solidus TaxID=70667 RepID=A0A183SXQ3_SCHSO
LCVEEATITRFAGGQFKVGSHCNFSAILCIAAVARFLFIFQSNLVRIELAPKVCTSADRLRDTLLHEACHAAVWLLHGVNDGHGPLWRGFARKANSLFPNIPRVTVRHAYAIDTRFTYECTGCGATVNRHSKSLDTEKKASTPVAISADRRYRSHDPVALAAFQAQPRSPSAPAPDGVRPRNPFAEFVRENYKTVRASCSHKEAMEQLGAMFRTMKLAKVNTDGPPLPQPTPNIAF